jgi:phosphoribosylformylglycinamidine cyclo-ligase
VVFERLRLKVRDPIPGLNRTVGRELLRPTRIYVKPIMGLLHAGVPVRAMAHITGGGLTGNLPRVLPTGCRAVIQRGTWPVPEVFRWLQRGGEIDEAEMFRVFNMGIGFVVVLPPSRAADALARLWKAGSPAFRIGEIGRGARGVEYR